MTVGRLGMRLGWRRGSPLTAVCLCLLCVCMCVCVCVSPVCVPAQQLAELRDHLMSVKGRVDERSTHDSELQKNAATFLSLLNRDFDLIAAALKDKQNAFGVVIHQYIAERLEGVRPQREEANACLAVTSKVVALAQATLQTDGAAFLAHMPEVAARVRSCIVAGQPILQAGVPSAGFAYPVQSVDGKSQPIGNVRMGGWLRSGGRRC